MPDNGFGGILQGIGSVLSPQFYQQKALEDAYTQAGMPPALARAGAIDPQAVQTLWQQKIFHDTFNAIKQQFPQMSDAEVFSRMSSPQGTQELFTPQPFGEYRGPGGISGPGVRLGNTVTPPFTGFNMPSGGAPSSPQQAQPSATPNSGIDNLAAQDARYAAQKAAAVKAAEQTATAQPDLPVLQTRSQQLIQKLERIKNNPELPNVVGGPLGIKGRAGPLGQGQSDIINDIQDANNALQGDLFTSLRATSGRGVSPGALKEMRITDLQSSRTGTLSGYKDLVDKTEKQIQEEYEAAWKARGSPDAYKPNWSAPSQTFPQPTAAHIQALRAQPQRATEFDSKFGTGAAMRVLGR